MINLQNYLSKNALFDSENDLVHHFTLHYKRPINQTLTSWYK